MIMEALILALAAWTSAGNSCAAAPAMADSGIRNSSRIMPTLVLINGWVFFIYSSLKKHYTPND
jgi:hypothetical protein